MTYDNFFCSGCRSVVGSQAMSLSDILVAAQVPPQHVDQLLNDGWTTDHFALCATSLEDFDAVMTEIFDTGLSPLHKASLRLAWKKCQSSSNQGTVAPAPAMASPEGAPQPIAGSWSETLHQSSHQRMLARSKRLSSGITLRRSFCRRMCPVSDFCLW